MAEIILSDLLEMLFGNPDIFHTAFFNSFDKCERLEGRDDFLCRAWGWLAPFLEEAATWDFFLFFILDVFPPP